jgi:hypothetical protein
VSPESLDIESRIVDLCSVVEAQMCALRRDYQHSIYEVCLGLQNRISKEMDRMVGHIRRLIDQNGFLYDRVVELEQRDDPEKVSRRTGNLLDMPKGQERLHTGSPEELAPIQRGGPRRRVPGGFRQAG